MTAKSTFKQSDIRRVLRGAIQAGLNAKSVRVASDGTFEITLSSEISVPVNDQNPWDAAVG